MAMRLRTPVLRLAAVAAATPRRSIAHVARNASFAPLTSAHVSALAALLDDATPSTVLSTLPCSAVPSVPDSELAAHNTDWMGKYVGQARVVLKPRTTGEVSRILAYCHAHALPIVPQGGNTGLVGGAVPVFDEVVLSLARMNAVRSFDPVAGTLVADAGCVLQALDDHVAHGGCMMPLDLGAKGSCHIGGNVSTNAGGLRFLRYGSLHGSVLGLEVVLADGTVVDALTTLRKDNTGYDLKQLFIGAEGTLGVVTAVSIITPARPAARNVAMLGLASFDAVTRTFAAARTRLGEVLSAFEFMDRETFDTVQTHATRAVRDPFAGAHPYYVVLETSGSCKEHDDAKLAALLEELLEDQTVEDGVLAADSKEAAELWALREGVAEACGHAGAVYKYDVSLPLDAINVLPRVMREHLASQGVLGPEGITAVCAYGHVGDGNLHLNIVSGAGYSEAAERAIEPFIYEWVAAHDGSISAEHGLGRMKAAKIGYSKSRTQIALMQSLKRSLDPKGILNPYKTVLV